ncbi:MAG: NAD(P)-binding protein [Acidimicrobiia bacterium]|nr:NAD(P)-binding protein [Acidimicrobiia bacterium]MYC58155.1 NAD(P)-binding protein [Acidimicrobiia bacterium]MYI30587.1 NAD(P)-binding protein [Acidimicrobiia bacterium]
MNKRVGIVGAGWTGAVAGRLLSEAGFCVEVFEKTQAVGGHSRNEILNGVVYEPNGAHIFHTSNEAVNRFVNAHGLNRAYEHKVLTEVYLSPDDDDSEALLLSWPPQVDELSELPIWRNVKKELANLPAQPRDDNFEDYVVSMMGRTLYDLFIKDYTAKQWGCPANQLSARFAPKRVELRRDGQKGLFRDRWQYFPPNGINEVIESVLSSVAVTLNAKITLRDADHLNSNFDALIITAALDDFAGCSGDLEWRGIEMVSQFYPTERLDGVRTAAYVVNKPSARVPYTRTVETKHATGQQITGTVVSEEMPGAPHRHYPVLTTDGANERRNAELATQISARFSNPVYFAGRLATYRYINQDEAIADAIAVAQRVIADTKP